MRSRLPKSSSQPSTFASRTLWPIHGHAAFTDLEAKPIGLPPPDKVRLAEETHAALANAASAVGDEPPPPLLMFVMRTLSAHGLEQLTKAKFGECKNIRQSVPSDAFPALSLATTFATLAPVVPIVVAPVLAPSPVAPTLAAATAVEVASPGKVAAPVPTVVGADVERLLVRDPVDITQCGPSAATRAALSRAGERQLLAQVAGAAGAEEANSGSQATPDLASTHGWDDNANATHVANTATTTTCVSKQPSFGLGAVVVEATVVPPSNLDSHRRGMCSARL